MAKNRQGQARGGVKSFKDKEGRWPRRDKAEDDKREVVLADGKAVLRDLADWMSKRKRVKKMAN